MLRVTTIVALCALALSTMASAEEPHGKGKPVAHPAVRGPVHAVPHAVVRRPVVHGPVAHGVVHGPIVHGPIGHGPVVGMHGGPHGPFMFHGHPFAWHPVHFAHPWVYPQGYGYRLWAVGAILPPLFWQRPDYYYNGWADMGLPPPDPGFQYVQYGPDLLLVNVSTGEVAQVFPAAFS